MKKDDDGLHVRRRVETIYAHRGFSSIDPADLRGRLRWWGLYTQRRPGIDGGKTAVLEPWELDDEYFMLRVRIDGGQLTTEQLRVIGEVSTSYARDTADLTDRQNVQLHWIRIEDVPAIWQRLEGVGLTTAEACGDTPRVILGSPVAGIAADEIVDGTPAIEEIHRRFIGNPAFSNLPRKFKTAVSGSPHQDVWHEVNDVSFVGVVHPSTAPASTSGSAGGCPPTRWSPSAWGLGARRGGGGRLGRHRRGLPRLRLSAAAQSGPDQVPRRGLGRRAVPAGAGGRPRTSHHRRAASSTTVVRTTRPRRHPPAARWPVLRRRHPASAGYRDRAAARRRRRRGARVAPRPDDRRAEAGGPRRAADQVEPLVTDLELLDLQARPSTFRRQTMACTGIEFCKLAIVETKARATLVAELEKRLPTFDTPLAIHVNGCPNSCARFQVADIGLKGMVVDGGEGFQVHLGGSLGATPSFGRKLRGLKVTAAELPDYVERVVRRYDEQRLESEAFAAWVQRAEEGDLQ